jgi:hypothetical protein
MRAVKILFTLGLALLICLAIILLPARLLFSGGESYTFYCGDSSKNCTQIVSDCPALTKLSLKNISGESVYYKALDVDKFKSDLGGEIKFIETLSDSVNYYCSAPLPYRIELYGTEINLHICVKDSGVIVASPIIFGGY